MQISNRKASLSDWRRMGMSLCTSRKGKEVESRCLESELRLAVTTQTASVPFEGSDLALPYNVQPHGLFTLTKALGSLAAQDRGGPFI
jgi:hypothetical protein